MAPSLDLMVSVEEHVFKYHQRVYYNQGFMDTATCQRFGFSSDGWLPQSNQTLWVGISILHLAKVPQATHSNIIHVHAFHHVVSFRLPNTPTPKNILPYMRTCTLQEWTETPLAAGTQQSSCLTHRDPWWYHVPCPFTLLILQHLITYMIFIYPFNVCIRIYQYIFFSFSVWNFSTGFFNTVKC